MTILSQRDSRWASIKLGTDASKTTIGSHGCLVTCLAMVAGTTPDDLNTRLKSVQGFKDDLVVWSKIKDAIPFDFSTPLTYDNDKVIAEIEKNGFCVVEVDFDGKIESPADRHWVLYIGNQRCYDPWTGVEKSTGWYPLVKRFAPCVKLSVVDTSLKWLRGMYQERGINLDLPEGEVRYRVQEIFDSAKKTEELKVQVNKLNQRVEEAEGEVKRLETASANDIQQLKDLKAEVEVLKKQVVNRDTQITALQERLSGLESQLDPQRVVVITKEEYARLTATKVLDKFTRWELTKEIIKRFFGKKVS